MYDFYSTTIMFVDKRICYLIFFQISHKYIYFLISYFGLRYSKKKIKIKISLSLCKFESNDYSSFYFEWKKTTIIRVYMHILFRKGKLLSLYCNLYVNIIIIRNDIVKSILNYLGMEKKLDLILVG